MIDSHIVARPTAGGECRLQQGSLAKAGNARKEQDVRHEVSHEAVQRLVRERGGANSADGAERLDTRE